MGSGKVRQLREYFEARRDAINPDLLLGIGEFLYNEDQVMHLQADLTAQTADTGFEAEVPYEYVIGITIDKYRKSNT